MFDRLRTNKLSRLLADSDDRKQICIQLLLTWLMSADGTITDQEMDFLDEAAPPGRDEAYLDEFLFMCDGSKYLEIQLACEYLRQHLSQRDKQSFIRLAVGMILADGRFSYMERYILEFFADLFGIGQTRLNEIYREMRGEDLPVLGDPSSDSWWHQHEAEYDARRKQRTTRSVGSEYGYSPKAQSDADRRAVLRSRALAILGLSANADRDAIQLAYRRLAQIHHPDRFQRLGPDAVQVASTTFSRIKKAKDFLLNG